MQNLASTEPKQLFNNAVNLNLQGTIASSVEFEGIGIHTGVKSKINICPASFESGYTFIRTDVKKTSRRIKANWKNVSSKPMCTEIINDAGLSVLTVEHLLAALDGASIFDAVIEIDGPEVPILDGSSICFSKELEKIGIIPKNLSSPIIKIMKPIHFTHKNSCVSFLPSNERKITVHFDGFNKLDTFLPQKQLTFDYKDFSKEIGFARTFGFLSDAEKLKEAGFAKGASLKNTIVIDNDKVINDGGLRSEDEILRHKILDVVGDMALSGIKIEGHFVGINPGHFVNNQLLRKVFETRDAWRYKMPYDESNEF